MAAAVTGGARTGDAKVSQVMEALGSVLEGLEAKKILAPSDALRIQRLAEAELSREARRLEHGTVQLSGRCHSCCSRRGAWAFDLRNARVALRTTTSTKSKACGKLRVLIRDGV
mmetsp:Transcript_93844/g.265115  ORF Transcript_93844/g.265115 Transcript_93844/m.265115 type:complete len:114 (+) Transcript_93844:69-410(+)